MNPSPITNASLPVAARASVPFVAARASVQFFVVLKRSFSFLSALTTIVLAITMTTAGCSRRASTASERQQKAIETLSGRPWYDAGKVAYRPPPVSSEFDDPLRTQGWEAPIKPATPAAAPRTGMWSGLGEGLSIFVWLSLGIGLIALAALLAAVSMNSWTRRPLAPKRFAQIEIDPTRVADLPFESADEMRDPLERARQLAKDGDYNAAVLYLYAYMLLALDRAGKIILHRGKTNRMYLMELSGQRRLRELLTPGVSAFEDVYFGRYDIDKPRYMQLWQSLDEFHQLLAAIMAEQTAAQTSAAPTGTLPNAPEVSSL